MLSSIERIWNKTIIIFLADDLKLSYKDIKNWDKEIISLFPNYVSFTNYGVLLKSTPCRNIFYFVILSYSYNFDTFDAC